MTASQTQQEHITTERLLLRRITQADQHAVFEVFSNPSVTEHYDCHPFTKISQAENWVSHQLKNYECEGKNSFRWAICLADNPNRLIGSCGFHAVNRGYSSFEVGYELHPNYWGQGLTTEALKAMIGFCFNHEFPFRVNRIAATTDLDSKASISVLKKLGFSEEGILREYGFWKDKFHDVRLFSLLRKEWQY